MRKTLIIIAAVILLLHGLIHLMGTTVYTGLGSVEGLPYKTTLLGGRWDLGQGGMQVFGALWGVAAVGFAAAAVALLAGWGWWRPALVAAALFSLVLTALDWTVAYAGVAVDMAILGLLWLGPRVAGRLSR